MPVLCLETSQKVCAVALMEGTELLATATSEEAHGAERHLPRLVQQVMGDRGFGSLDSIGVCSGPGSFTGLRAGIGFARGLALACAKPSYGVTATAALFAANPSGSYSLIALPARRRPPDKSWWVQAFCNRAPLSLPCEADTDMLSAEMIKAERLTTPDFSLEVLAESGGCIFEVRDLCVEHIGLALACDLGGSSPAAPVYAREPDARPWRHERPEGG